MYAILKVSNLSLLFGPTDWSHGAFADELRKLGLNVSLSTDPPAEYLDLGDIRVVPVNDQMPSYDPDLQTVVPTSHIYEDRIEYTYTIAELPIDQVRAFYVEKLNTIRKEKEAGGVIVDGLSVSTLSEHRAKMLEAQTAIAITGREYINFNYGAGYTLVPASQVTAIVKVVADHPQKCYDAAAVHVAAISKLKTAAEIKSYFVDGEVPKAYAGWPS